MTINDARAELEKYKDHERAIEDGYQSTETCVDGLGVPFVNSDVDDVSYHLPHVLLYRRTNGNRYELLGTEWFVPAESVDEGDSESGLPSMLTGEKKGTMYGPMEGHYSDQPRHYGLHAWLFTENPTAYLGNPIRP